MSYFETVKRPNEQLVFKGTIHWIVYLTPIISTIIGVALLSSDSPPGLGWLVLLFAFIKGVRAFYIRNTTEIAVTDKRVLLKRYWLARKTQEMNLSKVETVDFRQSVFQRMFGTGFVILIGTGGSWEPIGPLENPVQMRNAIGIG